MKLIFLDMDGVRENFIQTDGRDGLTYSKMVACYKVLTGKDMYDRAIL